MNETLDDVRLRAAEAQMRHALGLDGQAQAPRGDEQPPPQQGPTPDRLTLHRPPRRFVKDGEVPVTVVRRTHPAEAAANVAPAASNQLEAARQTIRSQAVATERAERALNDAQATIRDLRTKLAHERMAREEAFQTVRRLEADRDAAATAMQALRMEVATERVGREKLGQELRHAQEARRVAQDATQLPRRPRGRPRKVVVTPADSLTCDPLTGALTGAPLTADPLMRGPLASGPLTGDPLAMPRKRGRPRKVVAVSTEPPAIPRKRGRPRKVQVAEQATLDLPTANAPGRVGRPRKVREPKPVKWWVKGWKPTAGPRA